ncbi:MAG: class I SAM-dependent methyltransferase [Deltaproteobacteria bacterium]|nr:class I SAM-dependent methyltransferase [Deltaproteobacteria bacterium]
MSELNGKLDQFMDAGLKAVSRSRSIFYTSQGLILPLIDMLVHQRRPRLPTDDPKLFQIARKSLHDLLEADVARIRNGVYPVDVLRFESPIKHFLRIPVLFREGVKAALRKRGRKSQVFGENAKDLLSDVPEYYRRNFHFQPDGYLSDLSADLYEHQVEVLFAGAADSMRRLIIEPMKNHFAKLGASSDGEGLHFLEVGAGTGRATLFTRLAFPKAKIAVVDLSGPYLKRAQYALKSFPRHDFLEAPAENLPFGPKHFDAVYSVFLFHELPMEVRRAVLSEGHRVLKAGGFYGLVDSLQRGDVTEFDDALEQFPVEYHEPFYRNYIQNQMSNLLIEAGFKIEEQGTGFFSKFVAAKKQE